MGNPYLVSVRQLNENAEQMELTYQQAVKAGEAGAFIEAVEVGFAEHGDNLLLAAWHYRLAYAAASVKKRVIAWGWALPLALLNGLLLWLISDDQRFMLRVTNPLTGREIDLLPTIALLAAPISAAVIGIFLTGAGNKRWRRLLAVVVGLAVAAAYPLLLYPQIWPRVFQEQTLTIMILHLALLAWAGIGIIALGSARGDRENRFAFLVKSLEAIVVGGVFVIAGGLFTAITFGLFGALGIEPPNVVVRLFVAGGAGLIAVIAVALVYDPTAPASQQSFDEGASRLIAMLMRLLLPLTTLVLLVYLAFIPFNFWAPFESREVLLVFNAMLFAVIALMVGATPLRESELDGRTQIWLRRGVLALAGLALLVGLYALAAILYRTSVDRLTPNRLTFIGWNVINMGILLWLLFRQARAGQARWLGAMHGVFAGGAVLYAVWTAVIVLMLPWLFRGNPGQIAHLAPRIQEIAYEESPPVLLKCLGSPHIYLLENGEKRWIKDIPTFEAAGFRWNDVRFVSCNDLRAAPDGTPLPPDAGPPPQP